MTLPRDVFDRAILLIEERFNRDLSDPLRDFYYSRVAHLAAEVFEAQAAAVLAGTRFFPSPDDLLPSGPDLLTGLEWLERVMVGEDYEGAPAEVRRTLELMGGGRVLGMTPVDDVHFRRREFERLWGHVEQAERQEKALPPMTEAGRQLVDDAVAGRLGP